MDVGARLRSYVPIRPRPLTEIRAVTRFNLLAATLLFAVPAGLAAQTAILPGTPASIAPPVFADPLGLPAPSVDVITAASLALAAQASAAVATAGSTLKPGEFHWQADGASTGSVLVAVSIPDQKLYAYRNGALFAVSTVSTGKPGHATPSGAFPIMGKHREHYSNLYNNAPMPFMQRLTQDGIALHAGKLPGYPASHGCIRLPLAFARLLFGVTQRGDMVVVTDRPLANLAAQGAPFDARTGLAVTPPMVAGPVLQAPVTTVTGA